ncbi:NADPH-dependent F420 reductase [Pseudomonas frederiksbergensis]|uniref:NADP oxidoreductase coenzyme n=1 Tax=Pseudomonas frederiksbergensis TaxID=104087 RepID=A0A423KG93_9PSED|nr:NAD(P)-binding domain-containing protein [Pseudomonas frederiksbergensis]RON51836.1 NADP oxidoreductase coenzyme [Pseudomonas frederiksbergensis]
MTYSIIGSGKVGSALARQFARSGIPVGIANTRGTQSLAALVNELGEGIVAQSLEQALGADIVILAIPFSAHRDIAEKIADWNNKIVIDAMNTYGVPLEELGGRASTDVIASAFVGARVVKTFNQLPAALLAKDPAQEGGKRVIFVWSRDLDANTSVTQLVDQLGFAPISLGTIDEGGKLLGLGGPLILQNIIRYQ